MKHTAAALALLLAGTSTQVFAQGVIINEIGPDALAAQYRALKRIPQIETEAQQLEKQAAIALAKCDHVTVQRILGEMRLLGDEYRWLWPQQFADGNIPTRPDLDPSMVVHIAADEVAERLDDKCRVKEKKAEVPAAANTSDLAIYSAKQDVTMSSSSRSAADVRGELDSIVELCKNVTDEEDEKQLRARYERFFGDLRELRAIRDGLRERLAANDPTLDRNDALNQLKNLDEAIEGAIFPSQLKCGPNAPDLNDPDLSDEEFAVAAANFIAAFNVGVGEVVYNEPTAGIGFQSSGPGTETFADTVRTRFDSFSIGGGLNVTLSRSGQFFVAYTYSEGDVRSEFDIPSGGAVDVGFVYGDRSPGGSTGLNVGNRGLIGYNEASFDSHSIKFGASTTIVENGGFTVNATLFGDILLSQTEMRSQAQSTVFGSLLEQIRDQKLSNDYFGIGGGLSFRQPLTGGLALAGSAEGGVYYRDSELQSVETNDCPLCPASDQNFTLNIDDANSGTAFKGSLSAALEIDLGNNLTFSLGGTGNYVSDAKSVFNPSSGDQVLAGEATRLTDNHIWSWGAFAEIKIGFK